MFNKDYVSRHSEGQGIKEPVALQWQSSPSFIPQVLAEYLLCARQVCQVLGDKSE